MKNNKGKIMKKEYSWKKKKKEKKLKQYKILTYLWPTKQLSNKWEWSVS